jgi:hypothetical protein
MNGEEVVGTRVAVVDYIDGKADVFLSNFSAAGDMRLVTVKR